MANLVKIKNVYLYVALTDAAADCVAARKVLDAANIKYTELVYHNDAQVQDNLKALNTWSFGQDRVKRALTTFPVLHWDELYDDYETVRQVAHGLAEIQTSDLLKNAKLIVA